MDINENLPGKVYQFRLSDNNGITGYWGIKTDNKWYESNILTPEDSQKNVNDQFGISIALANNIAVIGANKKNRNNSNAFFELL